MFNVKNKMNDMGVSPVIGVILMVAVTVILAAVIGSFVLGLGSNVEQNPQAGVTFDQDGDSVSVQVVSMSNADYLRVSVDSDSGASLASDFTNVAEGDGSANNLENVGESGTVEGLGDGDTITVVGSLDGTESVIQTYSYSG